MDAERLDALCARLCRRLTDHDIYLDAPSFTLLGSGDLGVDLRFGNCRFENRFIPPLSSVGRLRNELRRSTAHLSEEEAIEQAEARIGITLTPQKGSRHNQTTWLMAGEDFVACRLEIEAHVRTSRAAGRGSSIASIEWPLECAKWMLPPLPETGSRRVSKWFRII
jgi:hypothetical protein